MKANIFYAFPSIMNEGNHPRVGIWLGQMLASPAIGHRSWFIGILTRLPTDRRHCRRRR